MSKLTLDQIKKFAPDSKSVTSAKSVADPRKWTSLGVDATGVLWGEYNGSDSYVLFVSSVNLWDNGCSCPSRKRPCKHVIGLLLLGAGGHPIETKDMPPYIRDEANNAYFESTFE